MSFHRCCIFSTDSELDPNLRTVICPLTPLQATYEIGAHTSDVFERRSGLYYHGPIGHPLDNINDQSTARIVYSACMALYPLEAPLKEPLKGTLEVHRKSLGQMASHTLAASGLVSMPSQRPQPCGEAALAEIHPYPNTFSKTSVYGLVDGWI